MEFLGDKLIRVGVLPHRTFYVAIAAFIGTIVATFVLWECLGHSMPEACRHQKVIISSWQRDSDDPICDENTLPEISVGAILAPEMYIYLTGLTIAGVVASVGFHFHDRAMQQMLCELIKGLHTEKAQIEALALQGCSAWCCADSCCCFGAWTLERLVRMCTCAANTFRVGQIFFFVQLYCTLRHSVAVHGIAAFLFFACFGIHGGVITAVHRGAYLLTRSALESGTWNLPLKRSNSWRRGHREDGARDRSASLPPPADITPPQQGMPKRSKSISGTLPDRELVVQDLEDTAKPWPPPEDSPEKGGDAGKSPAAPEAGPVRAELVAVSLQPEPKPASLQELPAMVSDARLLVHVLRMRLLIGGGFVGTAVYAALYGALDRDTFQHYYAAPVEYTYLLWMALNTCFMAQDVRAYDPYYRVSKPKASQLVASNV